MIYFVGKQFSHFYKLENAFIKYNVHTGDEGKGHKIKTHLPL